jgi:hypothetical protein
MLTNPQNVVILRDSLGFTLYSSVPYSLSSPPANPLPPCHNLPLRALPGSQFLELPHQAFPEHRTCSAGIPLLLSVYLKPLPVIHPRVAQARTITFQIADRAIVTIPTFSHVAWNIQSFARTFSLIVNFTRLEKKFPRYTAEEREV